MPLKYSWSRDNGPIPEKASYTEEYKVLIIPDAQLEDSGNYTCNVQRSNKAQANKTLSVQVEGEHAATPGRHCLKVTPGLTMDWKQRDFVSGNLAFSSFFILTKPVSRHFFTFAKGLKLYFFPEDFYCAVH